MNKAILSMLSGLLIIIVFSCKKQSFLDKTSSTDLNEQTVFADSAYTMDFLSGIYTDVGFSTDPTRFAPVVNLSKQPGAGLEAACDEAEAPTSGAVNTNIQFATGTVNATIVTNDAWKTPYTDIRRVNKFLQHLPEAKFSAELKTRVKAEARFLRAWYYAIMIQHYGGVTLLGDSIYDAVNPGPAARNTYEECVNYITSECDTAALDLPWVQTGDEYGRANKAACLGLKARVLLYAASPLFNGGGIAAGEPLKSLTGFASYDKERWKKAEDAALAVMSSNMYSLVVDNATEPGYGFYNVFTLRKSSELIFAKMQSNNDQLEAIWLPPTRGVTTPGAYPYLDLLNAFGMKNGLPIDDPDSHYDALHPYSNRDPRFGNSFVYDQSLVQHYPELTRIPVNIYMDASNPSKITSGQDAVHRGTPTGYYTYKMITRDVVHDWFNTKSPRCFPLIRYAEILLNFAEARNEYLGAPDQQVYSAVESIRERAGLVPYQLKQGLSQAEMRDVIRNERRVELAFEGFRFWDVRRWKIAGETETLMMHGTEPVKTLAGTTYKTIDVRKHSFTDKMYLWPIPKSEVSKSSLLLQNPGY